KPPPSPATSRCSYVKSLFRRGSVSTPGWGQRWQDPEHDPGQVPLEAAKRLAAALALGLLAGEERSRRSVHAPLGNRDPMQGAVELTVALAVEAMTLPLAGGSIEGGDTGELRQLGIAGEARDPGHLGEQLGGRQRPAAGQLEQ